MSILILLRVLVTNLYGLVTTYVASIVLVFHIIDLYFESILVMLVSEVGVTTQIFLDFLVFVHSEWAFLVFRGGRIIHHKLHIIVLR